MSVTEKFKIVRKGYDKEAVDSYINNMERINKDVSSDKSMRIEELKSEIEKLKSELREYKAREDSVTNALITSIERADEMENATKIRYALEGERIRLFREKWEKYCAENKTKLGIREKREKVSGFLYAEERELIEMMKNNFKMDEEPEKIRDVEQQYLDESKRLLNLAKTELAVDEFNLDDLNNIHDLDSVCRDLARENMKL